MMRTTILLITLAAIVVASVYLGTRWDEADTERAKRETLERANDADISKGDPDIDDVWVRDFLNGL